MLLRCGEKYSYLDEHRTKQNTKMNVQQKEKLRDKLQFRSEILLHESAHFSEMKNFFNFILFEFKSETNSFLFDLTTKFGDFVSRRLKIQIKFIFTVKMFRCHKLRVFLRLSGDFSNLRCLDRANFAKVRSAKGEKRFGFLFEWNEQERKPVDEDFRFLPSKIRFEFDFGSEFVFRDRLRDFQVAERISAVRTTEFTERRRSSRETNRRSLRSSSTTLNEQEWFHFACRQVGWFVCFHF